MVFSGGGTGPVCDILDGLQASKRSVIGHQGRRFCSPLTRDILIQALQHIPGLPGRRVLDVGCGKGEALGVAAAVFGCSGIGIDLNEEFLAEGAGVEGVELRCISASDFAGSPGEFQAAICLGSSQALGGPEAAMAVLREWVGPGGWIVQGELTFLKRPDPEFLKAMSMEEDSCPLRSELGAIAERQGMTLWSQIEVPGETFEEYEQSYLDRLETYALAHPDDPDSGDLLAMARHRRSVFDRWGRATLGFDLMVLQVPE